MAVNLPFRQHAEPPAYIVERWREAGFTADSAAPDTLQKTAQAATNQQTSETSVETAPERQDQPAQDAEQSAVQNSEPPAPPAEKVEIDQPAQDREPDISAANMPDSAVEQSLDIAAAAQQAPPSTDLNDIDPQEIDLSGEGGFFKANVGFNGRNVNEMFAARRREDTANGAGGAYSNKENDRVEDMTRQIQMQQARLNAIDIRLDEIVDQLGLLDLWQKALDDMDALAIEIADLEAEQQAEQATLAAAQQENTDLNAARDDITQRIEQINQNIEDGQDSLEAVREQKQNARQIMQEEQDRVRDATGAEYRDGEFYLRDRNGAYTIRANDDEQQRLREAHAPVAVYAERYNTLQEQEQAIVERLKALNQESEALRERYEELGTQIDNNLATISRSEARLEEINSALTAKNEQYASLENSLMQDQGFQAFLAENNLDMNDHSAISAAINDGRLALTEEQQRLLEERQEISQEIESLQRDHASNQSALESAHASSVALTAEHQSLNNDMAALDAERDALLARYDALISEREALYEEWKNADSEVARVTADVEAIRAEYERVREEAEELAERAAELQAEDDAIGICSLETAQAQEAAENKQKEAKSLREKLAEKDEELTRHQEERTKISTELEENRAKIETIQESLSDIDPEDYEALKQRLAELQELQELEDRWTSEKEVIDNDIDRLQADIEKLREELQEQEKIEAEAQEALEQTEGRELVNWRGETVHRDERYGGLGLSYEDPETGEIKEHGMVASVAGRAAQRWQDWRKGGTYTGNDIAERRQHADAATQQRAETQQQLDEMQETLENQEQLARLDNAPAPDVTPEPVAPEGQSRTATSHAATLDDDAELDNPGNEGLSASASFTEAAQGTTADPQIDNTAPQQQPVPTQQYQNEYAMGM